MNDSTIETRSVTVEREIAHPPERIWRALTQPYLIEEWLMNNDFKPVVGHRFELRPDWGAVECQVLEVEQDRTLSYTWGDHDLKTVVTWTLTPTNTGTYVRMEQTGFQTDQPRYYHGARVGWPQFITSLEAVLARMD